MKSREMIDDEGFILVWALLLMIVVTLLGVAGISTSIFERQMAANEALHRQAFYQADGGSENALAILVENINCISGFSSPTLDGNVVIDGSLNFWLANTTGDEPEMPRVSDRDFHYLIDGQDDVYTHGKISGKTELMTGANLPMLAGYELEGKSSATGSFLEYSIKVEHVGTRNSRAGIYTKFRLDNQFSSYPAGLCLY